MRFLTYHDLRPGKRAAAVEKVRAAIERDDLRTPDVKKLEGSGYYRAKLGDADRLLLQFVEHEGAKACLALEIIAQHAYDRSRFLRGAAVDEAKIDATSTPALEQLEANKARYLHPERTVFHVLDKPVSFDDAQDRVYRTKAPILLVGAAGSGKTALTLEKMKLARGDVLFVTQSPYLAETARSIYFSSGFTTDEQAPEFLSYRELLESIRVPAGRQVAFRDFRRLFERHGQSLRFTDAHRAFEEIRGVIGARASGPLSRDEYLALGVRQSVYPPAERGAIHDLFTRYVAFLDAERLYDTNFVAQAYAREVTPRFDFLVVDEVQDLTAAELALALALLREPGQFLLAGDANQIVHPNFFSWSTVKTLLFKDERQRDAQRVEMLDANFRNPRTVTALANDLLRIKHARFGSIDRESNALVRAVADEEGSVVTVALAALADLDARTRRSTEVAVIVLRDEDKEEARKRFRTPLLFSVHEAKGLEYETVILYRFIASERKTYAELCEGVTPADLTQEDLAYSRAKDKSDKTLEAYKFFVNALYVAITRAVKSVVLIEDDLAHPLLSLLGVRHGDAAAVDAKASSLEAWQREARKLELQGKAEQVEAIRRDVLNLAKVPWTILDAEATRALADKALAPKSVHAKARATLLEAAAFHEDIPLAKHLEAEGYAPANRMPALSGDVRKRLLAPFAAKNFKSVLWDVDRYGADFRNIHNQTPLMLAAAAGHAPLVEALLARGARGDLVDHFGRSAAQHLLLRVYRAEETPNFGALWDLLAPETIDVQVDQRLHKIGRHQAEHFFFLAMTALFKRLFRTRLGRFEGVRTETFLLADIHERVLALERLPATVVRPERRRRAYISSVLARNEPGSSYTPNRKLWVRERQGEYVPNPALLLRVPDASGEPAWRRLDDVLAVDALERHTGGGLRIAWE